MWAYNAWLWRRSLIVFWYALAVAALSRFARNRRPSEFFLVGEVAGALLFTKINLGCFFTAGLALVWVCHSGRAL